MAVKISPNVPPFVRFCAASVPMVFDNSMSYYETLCALTKFLQEDVVNVINNNAEILAALEEYVKHYFDNLDVQEEINNKLDEMAEQGQLEEIIATYLELGAVLAYNTTADLKAAVNISDGSTCMRLGDLAYKDGEIAYYKIRTKQPDDVIDEDNILALTVSDQLVAEKLKDKRIDDLQDEIETQAADNIDVKVGYSYELSTYYTVMTIPRDQYTFDLVNYSNYTDGVYKYVNAHPDHVYANGQLESPTIINGEVTINNVPLNAEYWYILGCDAEGNMKYTKDLTRQYNGNTLLSDGYYEAFGVWCPITLNGDDFIPATELNTSDPNYAYIINGRHTRTIFGYDNNNFYIITIEGRTSRSKGCNFSEMLTLIHELSIPNTFNMDGGGSSQLWVSNPTYNLVFSDGSTSTKGYSSRRVFSLIKFNKKG